MTATGRVSRTCRSLRGGTRTFPAGSHKVAAEVAALLAANHPLRSLPFSGNLSVFRLGIVHVRETLVAGARCGKICRPDQEG